MINTLMEIIKKLNLHGFNKLEIDYSGMSSEGVVIWITNVEYMRGGCTQYFITVSDDTVNYITRIVDGTYVDQENYESLDRLMFAHMVEKSKLILQ